VRAPVTALPAVAEPERQEQTAGAGGRFSLLLLILICLLRPSAPAPGAVWYDASQIAILFAVAASPKTQDRLSVRNVLV
jgi:hypothetical protein